MKDPEIDKLESSHAQNMEGTSEDASPEREKKIKEKVSAEVQKLPLNQLREARNLTQTSLADLLHIPQGSISRLEQRTDMYVSTLRNYIRAMGGDLKITAVFPNGSIEISQFQDVEYRG